MKNYLSRTFGLILLVTLFLLLLQWLPTIHLLGIQLREVDMLSSIRPDVPQDSIEADSLLPPPPKPVFVDSCKTGLTCIEDYSDSTQRGMQPFYEALAHMDSLSRPVRIAYFGDSFIEGDILTADLRALLQERFGGKGVGFVDITSPIHGFRPTVNHSFDGWESHATTDSLYFNRSLQGIAERYFLADGNAWVELNGKDKYAPNLDTCQTATLYYRTENEAEITSTVNRTNRVRHTLTASGRVESCQISGEIGRVRWEVESNDSSLLCYGVALDGLTGISLDNFSLRGSSGLSIRSIPLTHLKQFNKVRPYDLIVLQFGLNVATPRGVKYDGYYKGMLTTIAHLKEAFPQAGILVVSVGDRAYKNDEGELATMPGVKNLIRYQQRLAADSQVAFWNLFLGMGGEGSMPEMVEAEPALANLDYTHINFRGGKHLAEIFYETLLYGYEQYERKKTYESLP